MCPKYNGRRCVTHEPEHEDIFLCVLLLLHALPKRLLGRKSVGICRFFRPPGIPAGPREGSHSRSPVRFLRRVFFFVTVKKMSAKTSAFRPSSEKYGLWPRRR